MITRTLVPMRERPLRELFPRTLTRIEQDMEDLFDRLFHGREGWLTFGEGLPPRADLIETDKGFEVTVDLPGLKPEEVTVEIKNGDLWITGEHKEEKEEEGKTYHRAERHHGTFQRIMPLPAAVDETAVDAQFERGVLTVKLPKTPEATTKKIDVKADNCAFLGFTIENYPEPGDVSNWYPLDAINRGAAGQYKQQKEEQFFHGNKFRKR